MVSLTIWIPFIAAVVVAFLPDRTADHVGRIRSVGLFGSGAVLLFSLLIAFGFIGDPTTLQGTGTPVAENHDWISSFVFSSSYRVDIDGMSLPLLQLTGVLFCSAAIHAWRRNQDLKLYVGSLLVLETAVVGVLAAQDLLLLMVFWGMMIAPLYMLLRLTLTETHAAAGRFAVQMAVGLTAVLAGVALMASHTPAGTGHKHTFQISQIVNGSLDVTNSAVAHDGFVVMLAGFWLMAAIVPLHRWLVQAGDAPDPAVVSLITGLISKLPILIGLRIALQTFPLLTTQFSLVFLAGGLAAGFWALMCSWRSRDLRQAVAYFGVAQNAIAVAALGSTAVTSLIGITLLLVGQGLAQAILSYVAEAVISRAKTSDISRLGGLAWQAPRLAAFSLLAGLSLVGVPLLSGFTAIFLVALGGFSNHHVGSFFVVGEAILSGFVILRLALHVFLGEEREHFARVKDLNTVELSLLAPLAAGIVLYGVLPGRIIPVIEATAKVIATRIGGGQ